MAKRTNKRGYGFSLLEAALSLTILSFVIAGSAEWEYKKTTNAKAEAAAERLSSLRIPAERYIVANFATLTKATATGVIAIPTGRQSTDQAVPEGPVAGMPSLQSGGFLPENYIDSNPYGQRTSLLVRQSAPGKLESMLVTWGGVSIPDAQLGHMVQTLGPLGGFMMSHVIGTAKPDTILGAYGGWRQTSQDWLAGASSPTPGHAVTLMDEATAPILNALSKNLTNDSQTDNFVADNPDILSGDIKKQTAAITKMIQDMKAQQQRQTCETFAICDKDSETGATPTEIQ